MKKAPPYQSIGLFIKELRQRRGMTQQTFAKALDTSQSAVARMEKGAQNLSTAQLLKISDVLEHQVIGLKTSTDFRIIGGRKIHGTAVVNTSKNGALALLCGSLLNEAPTTIHGVPHIEEIARMIEIFQSIGVRVEYLERNVVKVTPPKQLHCDTLDISAAQKIRSVLMLVGPLLHREKTFDIPHAGGCVMGERTIAAHKHVFEALGAEVQTGENSYTFTSTDLRPNKIVMYEASDTATINALLLAAKIPGETVIAYAPPNYQVQDVCFLLQQFGVRIEGVGTTTLVVHGVASINTPVTHFNSEDPIEAMMFITAALVTKGTLKIQRCPVAFLEVELLKLSYMGAHITQSKTYVAHNGHTLLVDITVHPSTLIASPVKIHPLPYPGLNIDNLPFFVPIATQAEGTTLIHDWTWEGRAIYFTELNRLGARIQLADPHRIFVTGPTTLKGAQVVCPPALRPAVVILLAMLAAEGESVLRNVYSIARGYERIAERLNEIGAHIEILNDLNPTEKDIL